jgi:hypothetical protein
MKIGTRTSRGFTVVLLLVGAFFGTTHAHAQTADASASSAADQLLSISDTMSLLSTQIQSSVNDDRAAGIDTTFISDTLTDLNTNLSEAKAQALRAQQNPADADTALQAGETSLQDALSDLGIILDVENS